MGILDSLTKNPSLIALAALGIGLFVFRDKISGFFSDITGGAEGAAQIAETGGILGGNLTSNLTGIQDILSGEIFKGFEFPSFELPSFELPKFPKFDFPKFDFPSLPDFLPDVSDFPAIFPGVGNQDITTTPAAIGRSGQRGRITDVVKALVPQMALLENLNTQNVQTGLDTGQQFMGDGPSFIAGTVNEIPLERQSLNDIINDLGVSSSRASSLRAEAIGFNESDQAFLNMGQELSPLGDLGPQVSDEQFQGLSIQEIALRLTGGNISNF